MNDKVHSLIEIAALSIESVGIIVIVIGSIISLGRFVLKKQNKEYRSFKLIREELGRSIVLGLEFLVAADIIATVVYDSTMDQVLKLGLIVLIRTFLSFALETEIEGKFPWKQNDNKSLGKK